MANGYMHLAVQERALIETQLRLGMSPGGGWPRLLTLVATTKRVGAPSFAHFAKGGYYKRQHLRSYAARSRNEIFPHPSFTLTARPLRVDTIDNCSSAIVRATPPVPAESDSDAYT